MAEYTLWNSHSSPRYPDRELFEKIKNVDACKNILSYDNRGIRLCHPAKA